MANTRYLSAVLRQLRIHNELTQKQLAEDLYISRQAISTYETGRTLPPSTELARLASYYDYPYEVLFSLTSEPRYIRNSSARQLISELESCSFFSNIPENKKRFKYLNEGELMWLHLYHTILPSKRVRVILALRPIITHFNALL